jgi:hypothetical protein
LNPYLLPPPGARNWLGTVTVRRGAVVVLDALEVAVTDELPALPAPLVELVDVELTDATAEAPERAGTRSVVRQVGQRTSCPA